LGALHFSLHCAGDGLIGAAGGGEKLLAAAEASR